jgi:hypothetical protein
MSNLRKRAKRNGSARGVGVETQYSVAGGLSFKRTHEYRPNDQKCLAGSRAASKASETLRPIQEAARRFLARAE